jgi:hypothetical protein
MESMVNWAAFTPGQTKRVTLTGGLGIDVICGLDGMWRLQIWREGTSSSDKEWETVLKAWPGEPPSPGAVRRFVHKGRQYMQGEWTTDGGDGE